MAGNQESPAQQKKRRHIHRKLGVEQASSHIVGREPHKYHPATHGLSGVKQTTKWRYQATVNIILAVQG